MEYNFRKIEKHWQKHWKDTNAYKVENNTDKPKYYVLDMFPYPSGAGLHVGHPLGYIASDIYARYKRLKGFNVLHPMGFDSFGLPAEQYALETGQHPAVTTEKNIARYKEQLDNIGFSYDWSREVRTSDPQYYKWTQKIFLELYNSYFCNTQQKARPIADLIKKYEIHGAMPKDGEPIAGRHFTADQWNNYTKAEQEEILMKRRLAFSAFGEVNWCEALGTVLANDEVINGVSERGGHPVVKKKMRQWYLRITAYADRLLEGLEKVDFSESMKEMQRNWIGRSEGAELAFSLSPGSTSPQPLSRGEGQEEKTAMPAISLLEKLNREPGYMTNTWEQWKFLSAYAKENRKHSTEAEDIIWQQVRNRHINGYKFRRQHPIAGYIPDFVCLEKKLIIEIDGEYHDEAAQQKCDEARTGWLAEHGYSMLRFTKNEVSQQLTSILQKIEQSLAAIMTPGDKSASQSAEQAFESPLSFGEGPGVRCYTTRPDTIFGVDFLVLAPEHELVSQITTGEQQEEINKYLDYVKSRSDRERQAEVKQITGAFTGAYAVNPFSGKQIPIWISEYVLAGYGTGAIMAVPCGDQRDFAFAQHFNIPITNIIGEHFNGKEANPTKEAVLQNSGFLDGLLMKDAIAVAIDKIEDWEVGKRKVNYKMRDAGFSRQRYWGEPFPIAWKDGVVYPLPESELPLLLPHMEEIKPGKQGEGPLSNNEEWINDTAKYFENNSNVVPPLGGGGALESSTMPGYAGSSWYFLRYMDPHNDQEFAAKNITDYWNQVDLYVGGTEHAVGHLLYSRMWTKVLYDLGYINFDEPFKKLLNQGMIQGLSEKIIRAVESDKEEDNFMSTISSTSVIIWWKTNKSGIPFTLDLNKSSNGDLKFFIWNFSAELIDFVNSKASINVPIEFVEDGVINLEDYMAEKTNRLSYTNTSTEIFLCRDGFYNSENKQWLNYEQDVISPLEFRTIRVSEKMSKSKRNVVNPDDMVEKYGADTFRMYEMFLGPVEQSKPWDTKGIEGVHRFLRKLWRLFADEEKGMVINTNPATPEELKVLHRTIKKIEDDTERFSFNTAVSTFMIAVNELHDLKCHKREILEPLVILLTPYAPHIAEETWQNILKNNGSVLSAVFPKLEEKYLVESSKEYPISINGKVRSGINISLEASQSEVEKLVLQNETVQKWLEGKAPKKIIFVKGKMINVVI